MKCNCKTFTYQEWCTQHGVSRWANGICNSVINPAHYVHVHRAALGMSREVSGMHFVQLTSLKISKQTKIQVFQSLYKCTFSFGAFLPREPCSAEGQILDWAPCLWTSSLHMCFGLLPKTLLQYYPRKDNIEGIMKTWVLESDFNVSWRINICDWITPHWLCFSDLMCVRVR